MAEESRRIVSNTSAVVLLGLLGLAGAVHVISSRESSSTNEGDDIPPKPSGICDHWAEHIARIPQGAGAFSVSSGQYWYVPIEAEQWSRWLEFQSRSWFLPVSDILVEVENGTIVEMNPLKRVELWEYDQFRFRGHGCVLVAAVSHAAIREHVDVAQEAYRHHGTLGEISLNKDGERDIPDEEDPETVERIGRAEERLSALVSELGSLSSWRPTGSLEEALSGMGVTVRLSPASVEVGATGLVRLERAGAQITIEWIADSIRTEHRWEVRYPVPRLSTARAVQAALEDQVSLSLRSVKGSGNVELWLR